MCLLKDTDILYLRLMGKDTIILNSNEAISDLLDKRSIIYSDRVSDADIFTFGSSHRVAAPIDHDAVVRRGPIPGSRFLSTNT
jgi:hypothetical protein